MKAANAKAAKAMKSKRVSKVARGRFAKALVLRGSKEKTTGGLKREALMKNTRGKVVSKRASANGKRQYKRIQGWTEAHMAARNALKIKGFVPINGKGLVGKALYVKTQALRAEARAEAQAA